MFFGAWKDSSHLIFDQLSENKIFKILEGFSTFREFIWPHDNYEYFLNLPDQLVIYRGGTNQVEELVKGYSWSFDVRFAEAFAKQNDDGKIIKASVNKLDIIYCDPNQFEAVPRKNSIKSLKLVG